jgi:hypothetical protein
MLATLRMEAVMGNKLLAFAILGVLILGARAGADSEAPGMPARVTALEEQMENLTGVPTAIAALQEDVAGLGDTVGDLQLDLTALALDFADAQDRLDELEEGLLALQAMHHPLTVHIGTVPSGAIQTFVVKTEDLPGAIGEARTVVASWRTNNGAHGWTLARVLNSAGTQHQTLAGFGPCGSAPAGISTLSTNTFTYTKGVPPGGVHEFKIFNNTPIAGCQGGTITGLTFTFR